MTDRDPTPDSVAWLRERSAEARAVSRRVSIYDLDAGALNRYNADHMTAIADELEQSHAEIARKDARIAELRSMLEVGCDICGGAHHNNQHDLLEAGYVKDAEIARLVEAFRDADARYRTENALAVRLQTANAALAALVSEAVCWQAEHDRDNLVDYDWLSRAKAALAQTEQK